MKAFDLEEDDFRPLLSQFDWRWLDGGSVLIAGAAGMIPSYVGRLLCFVRRELQKDFRLLLLARDRSKIIRAFRHPLDQHWVHLIEDRVDGDRDIPHPVTHIIHGASAASPLQYMQDPIGTIRANVGGSERLLKLAEHHPGVVYLFLSSSEVYGSFGDRDLYVEERQMGSLDPLGPRACYPEAKRMGEALAMAWHIQKGSNVRIARIFHTFGPGINLMDGRCFSDFLRKARNKENVVLRSKGLSKRSFSYISDTTMALMHILALGQPGHAYNVGNPEGVITIAEFARLVAEAAGVGLDYNIENLLESQSASVFPDTSKLQLTGWRPSVSLRDAVRRTLESISE